MEFILPKTSKKTDNLLMESVDVWMFELATSGQLKIQCYLKKILWCPLYITTVYKDIKHQNELFTSLYCFCFAYKH